MSFEAFRGSSWPTLGVELELQLVDAETMALRPAVADVLAAVPEPLRPYVKPEFHQCCVEINTAVCGSVGDVAADLELKLRQVERLADRLGLRIAWGGTHPFSHWREQTITSSPRYHELAECYQETLLRQLTFGLHVHVGMTDGDAAARACDGIRRHLPALLALSANSPFWCGRATGLLAHRIDVLGASPISGVPHRFGDWRGFVRLVDQLMDGGIIATPKELWWDARPSSEYGTVEVRICDMPADLASVLTLTALIQCLTHYLANTDDEPSCDEEAFLLMIQQNRWRAARYGLDAEFANPAGGDVVPARCWIKRLVKRMEETAASLGCLKFLRQAAVQADGPTWAERQLAVYRRTGSLESVVSRQIHGLHDSIPSPNLAPIFSGAPMLLASAV